MIIMKVDLRYVHMMVLDEADKLCDLQMARQDDALAQIVRVSYICS